jgi:hypothetical protein
MLMSDHLYAPGQVIVNPAIHTEPTALRLRIRPGVGGAAHVGHKVARRSVFGNQQARRGSAVGYGSSTWGLEVWHAGGA